MRVIFLLFFMAMVSCQQAYKKYEPKSNEASAHKDAGSDVTAPLNPNQPVNITVLFGTDRKVNTINNIVSFANMPANPGKPNYSVGYTVVSIPPNHQEGQIESPSIWKLEFHEDTLKHMVEKEIKLVSNADFNMLLKKNKAGQDAFVFVHGFNNSFQEAALRTAQLATDIHLPVTPIMFSWSSNKELKWYSSDEDNVQKAVVAFEDFLKRIARESNFKKIHLIAHSMGNRLVTSALEKLLTDTTNLKLDQIIMAAPDVDADLFQLQFGKALTQKAHHVTIYAAKNDWALAASKKLHRDLRLGELGVPPPKYVFDKIDVIDAVNQKTDFLGHDRFARSATIISDMNIILKTGLSASQRNIPHKNYGDYIYYFFK